MTDFLLNLYDKNRLAGIVRRRQLVSTGSLIKRQHFGQVLFNIGDA
jgi:hypothetical protein